MAEVAFIALGSNLGDRNGYLAGARAALAALPGSRIQAVSAVEETLPLGGSDQPAYLNQMIALETDLEPEELMTALLRIERDHGRERGERWSSRTLDLDIVAFGSRHIATDRLAIPHPGLASRDFWQRQLAEVQGSHE